MEGKKEPEKEPEPEKEREAEPASDEHQPVAEPEPGRA